MLARLSRKILFFREEKIAKEPSNYQDLLSGHEKHLPMIVAGDFAVVTRVLISTVSIVELLF
jgi:hypothetical protein